MSFKNEIVAPSLGPHWMGFAIGNIKHLVILRISAGNTQVATTMVDHLMHSQELLYNDGARNFVSVNVPPIHKAPAGRMARLCSDPNSNAMWNTELLAAVKS
ncbi:hypothetical protein OF83DRAFT_1167727 [Amylostereum chailletii]|nr:hypothetical protein OF83DRAFT_1167727 [Amylostereum chailletii]